VIETKPSRRSVLAAALLLPLAGCGTQAAPPASAASAPPAPARTDRLPELERRFAARLGVYAVDTGSGRELAHRADEPFAMCSVFKALAAAAVLQRTPPEHLDERVRFTRADVLDPSPVAAQHVADGMTVRELCDAAVRYSDNTAGNLLLASFGGPAGLTAFLRSLGDEASRLDRIEPELNAYAGPGDPRDTTTPAAVLETLRKLLFGDALSAASRHRLAAWLITNKTGDARLRAGFPAGWLVGDKTGTGGNPEGSTNDIAVAWPVDRGPVLVAAYCELPSLTFEQRNPVVAEIGGIVARL